MKQSALLQNDGAGHLVLSDTVQMSESGIVSRTLLQSRELRVVLFAFGEGQELTQHTSTRRALIQVLSGSCDFFFNGRWERLSEGALLHMAPKHPHAVRAAYGPFSMLLTLGAEPSVGSGGDANVA